MPRTSSATSATGCSCSGSGPRSPSARGRTRPSGPAPAGCQSAPRSTWAPCSAARRCRSTATSRSRSTSTTATDAFKVAITGTGKVVEVPFAEQKLTYTPPARFLMTGKIDYTIAGFEVVAELKEALFDPVTDDFNIEAEGAPTYPESSACWCTTRSRRSCPSAAWRSASRRATRRSAGGRCGAARGPVRGRATWGRTAARCRRPRIKRRAVVHGRWR